MIEKSPKTPDSLEPSGVLIFIAKMISTKFHCSRFVELSLLNPFQKLLISSSYQEERQLPKQLLLIQDQQIGYLQFLYLEVFYRLNVLAQQVVVQELVSGSMHLRLKHCQTS